MADGDPGSEPVGKSPGMPPQQQSLESFTYEELLVETLARIPVHNPDWADFNQGDPGITMLELFAYVAEGIADFEAKHRLSLLEGSSGTLAQVRRRLEEHLERCDVEGKRIRSALARIDEIERQKLRSAGKRPGGGVRRNPASRDG